MRNIERTNGKLVFVGLLLINESTFSINHSSFLVIERIAFDTFVLFKSRTRIVEGTNEFRCLSVVPIDHSSLPISKEEEVLLNRFKEIIPS